MRKVSVGTPACSRRVECMAVRPDACAIDRRRGAVRHRARFAGTLPPRRASRSGLATSGAPRYATPDLGRPHHRSRYRMERVDRVAPSRWRGRRAQDRQDRRADAEPRRGGKLSARPRSETPRWPKRQREWIAARGEASDPGLSKRENRRPGSSAWIQTESSRCEARNVMMRLVAMPVSRVCASPRSLWSSRSGGKPDRYKRTNQPSRGFRGGVSSGIDRPCGSRWSSRTGVPAQAAWRRTVPALVWIHGGLTTRPVEELKAYALTTRPTRRDSWPQGMFWR